MRSLPTFLSRKPYWEPVRETFIPIKGKAGEEVTLRLWRDDVHEPLSYEIINKKTQVRIASIEIQEREIEKQLLRENPAPAEWTVEGFSLVLKNILQEEYSFLKDNLESDNPRGDMILYESDHPLALYLKLNPSIMGRIFYNIDKVIEARDRAFLKDFVERHNDEGDVMLLKVIWDFE